MLNPIKSIVKFNKDAGLLDNGYDDFLESSFQIEEALEGFNTYKFAEVFQELSKDSSPKDISRVITSYATMGDRPVPDVDRLDKACDAVVFAVGSMVKLGLNAQEITKALNIVMQKNFDKLGAPRDEFGKQTKPAGWTGPEPELQLLLDNLSSAP